MSERLTTDELKAIRERCEAATAGPWLVQRRYSNECEIVPRITCEPSAERKCGWIADMVGAPYLGYADTIANADFIAHARADVPRLLAEVERLRAKAAELDKIHAVWRGDKFTTECDGK